MPFLQILKVGLHNDSYTMYVCTVFLPHYIILDKRECSKLFKAILLSNNVHSSYFFGIIIFRNVSISNLKTRRLSLSLFYFIQFQTILIGRIYNIFKTSQSQYYFISKIYKQLKLYIVGKLNKQNLKISVDALNSFRYGKHT